MNERSRATASSTASDRDVLLRAPVAPALTAAQSPGRVSVTWHIGILVVVWAASVGYVWLLLDRGWVPHDEGTLGQSALRVLQGEVPHRDYEEIYTGGLTYLNALAFEIWGVHLLSLRYMAYLFFACWIPVVYYLASRWLRPMAAGLLTLTAAAWSYPAYLAAMPSWYTLYCATGAVACLTRYVEVRRTGWLAGAGVLAGLSCLFKITGLYAVAGSLLFLVYLEQREGARAPVHGAPGASSAGWYRLIVTAGLVGFGTSVFLLVLPRLGLPELVQFVLPSWTAVGLLLAGEWSTRRGRGRERLRTALALFGPFLVGFVLPVLAMLAYFAAQGALGDLLSGVLVKPFRRLTTAAQRPPPALALLATGMVAAVPVLLDRFPGSSGRRMPIALGALAAVLLALVGVPGLEQIGYLSVSQSVPVVVAASALLLWRHGRVGALRGTAPEHLALLAFTCATYTLVQYPYSTPTYFAFTAPLVFLAAAAVVTIGFRQGSAGAGILLALYLCYAVLWFTPRQFRVHNSAGLLRGAEIRTLLPGIAGLEVSLAHWQEYETLIPLVAQKAGGEYIFSGPDSPEVYFLSGRRNPTRSLFDFFDEQEGRTTRILNLIERRGVRLVVINNDPLFSPPLDSALAGTLRARYPHDSTIGRFTVRWN